MMTFMKSKLTKMTGKDKKNYIFQKGKPYEISRTDICAYIHTIYIYIYEDRFLLFKYFTGVSH